MMAANENKQSYQSFPTAAEVYGSTMHKPLKLLFIASGFEPGTKGGVERVSRNLAEALAERGHTVGLATGEPDEVDFDGVVFRLRRIEAKWIRKTSADYWLPGNAGRLQRAIMAFQPDVVHFHSIYGMGSALIAVSTAMAPTVVTFHDYWPCEPFSPTYSPDGSLHRQWKSRVFAWWVAFHRRLNSHFLRKATLVAPSHFVADWITAHTRLPVAVVPNGVPQPTAASLVASTQPVVLFAGRLAKEKGLHTMIPALRVLHQRGWRCLVAGDGPERSRLERAMPFAEFLGWVDLEECWALNPVLLVPSIWPENQPLAVLEALVANRPVVAARVGGIPEILPDKALFSPYRWEEAVARLEATRQAYLSEAELTTAADEFLAGRMAERYELLYQGGLSQARVAPREIPPAI